MPELDWSCPFTKCLRGDCTRMLALIEAGAEANELYDVKDSVASKVIQATAPVQAVSKDREAARVGAVEAWQQVGSLRIYLDLFHSVYNVYSRLVGSRT